MEKAKVLIAMTEYANSNILSAFPEFSWQRFLGSALLAKQAGEMYEQCLEKMPFLKDASGGVDINELRDFFNVGFARQEKLVVPLLGEQFTFYRRNADDFLQLLETVNANLN